MERIFISYSTKDTQIASRIAGDLQKNNYDVWLDSWQIVVGDSITQEIEKGLDNARFLLVLISTNSLKSGWVEKEWKVKLFDEAEKNNIIILPLKIDNCKIPSLLKDKKYADFTLGYDRAFNELLFSMQIHIAREYDKCSEQNDSITLLDNYQNKETLMAKDSFAIGIDVGTANFYRGVVSFPIDYAQSPEIVEPLLSIKWDAKKEANFLVDKIVKCVEDTASESFIRPKDIFQIGIGLPGQVDPINGILLKAPGLGLEDLDVANMVKKRLIGSGRWSDNLRVLIDNDVTCMTLAEKAIGEGKANRVSNFVCVAIGKGIGAGIVADGNLYRGSNFNAGEFGHMTIDLSDDARKCYCESKGCLEEYCSERGILQTAARYISEAKKNNPDSALAKLSDDISVLKAEEVSDIISSTDTSVIKLCDKLARHLAIGLSNIANILNPQLIVIAGGVGLGFFQHTAFQNNVNKYVRAYVLDACKPKIVQSRIKKNAQIIGAAMLESSWFLANLSG